MALNTAALLSAATIKSPSIKSLEQAGIPPRSFLVSSATRSEKKLGGIVRRYIQSDQEWP